MPMQQSSQKNQAFFLQGLLFLCKKAVFEPSFGILAEKKRHFLCEDGGVVEGEARGQEVVASRIVMMVRSISI